MRSVRQRPGVSNRSCVEVVLVDRGQCPGVAGACRLRLILDRGGDRPSVVDRGRTVLQRCRRRRIDGDVGRIGVTTAGVGRHGQDDLHVDGRVAGDQVGEGLAAGLLDVRAGAGGDEVVGEAVDRGPRRGGVLAREGAVPLVDPGLGHPAAEPGRGPGPPRALADQVGGDAVEQHPGAPAQCRGVVAEVTRQCGHDRVGHVCRCDLELERDDTRPVAVEVPFGHRLVQPTQPARLGSVPVVGLHRHPARGQPNRLFDAALGLRVRRPDHRRDDVGGVDLTRPAPCTISPSVPSSHHTLSRRAASAIAMSCTAVTVLSSDWQSLMTSEATRRDLAAPGSASVARAGAHRSSRPLRADLAPRWEGWRCRPMSARCADAM